MLLGLASRTRVVLVLSKCGISLARCLLFGFALMAIVYIKFMSFWFWLFFCWGFSISVFLLV